MTSVYKPLSNRIISADVIISGSSRYLDILDLITGHFLKDYTLIAQSKEDITTRESNSLQSIRFSICVFEHMCVYIW